MVRRSDENKGNAADGRFSSATGIAPKGKSMVVGFNHNFPHNGQIYHIQTEDGGLGSPNIVTLLYHGGTILASRKTSYADIARVDNLEQVVEELMKEQHKGMLRSLKNGEFDEAIARYQERTAPAATPAPVVEPPPAPPAVAPSSPPAAVPDVPPPPVTADRNLEELVLAYLSGGAV